MSTGVDIPYGDHVRMVTLLYVHGLLGIHGSSEAATIAGFKPREFPLSVGYIF